MQAQIVIDGAQQYGTRTLTFSSGCVAVCEDFSFETPVSIAEDKLATGAPNRSRMTAGITTGKGTIQIPGTIAASNRPAFGSTFTVTGATTDPNYSDFTFVVSKCPDYEESNDPTAIRKCPIEFRRVVNSITTSGTW